MARLVRSFSALQRAEIAETPPPTTSFQRLTSFSALQRAEIAEIPVRRGVPLFSRVSVLFNEPKLLKSSAFCFTSSNDSRFSALQRAEIAEMRVLTGAGAGVLVFQCSSTSRNC